MPFYQRVGDVPRKRHSFHRQAGGARLAEELMGQEGFSGASSLLYHRHSPSALIGVEDAAVPRAALRPNVPLLPWHLRATDLRAGGEMVTGRRLLLATSTLQVCWVAAERTSGLYRNAAGD